ncbi:uncharacterized protein LOC123523901 [Mercenaria mercenaria]|uniref:uncharacterized protein LOC123523901 n=1 Tax=Mercenaria mercenaria TaxID=6596 RepID=UPI00234F5F5B|nr:uncharacterized protein LOC123523901 [Mercenaria mercenaria]
MTDEEAIVKEVSTRISKELERKGHSKHKLETTSWLVNIRENVGNKERGTQPLFLTGSNAEGTDITGSDRDTMVVFPNCIIVADNKEAEIQQDNNVFLMVQDGTRPCYTKLQILHESRNHDKNDLFQRLGGKEKLCVLDEMGRYFFSSEMFTEQVTHHVSSLTQSSDNHIVSSFHVHGPCATFDNIVGKTQFDTDFAYCIPCNILPTEAYDFIRRNRQYNWPPENLIRKHLSQGCHVVSVGDKASPAHSVEWRISFALLERELVWGLNDTQCKCYIILKMLLKMYLDKLAPDELSSFALKTVIFWCAETEGPSLWKEENLLCCVFHCLSKLQSYVAEKNLPHFIVPGNNLLATKFEDAETRAKVTEQLSEMTKWHWSKLLQCPALSELKLQWDELDHDVKLFLRCSRHPNISVLFYRDIVTFRGCQSLYMDINSYLATTDNLQNMLQSFKSTKVDERGRDVLEFGSNALSFKMEHIQRKTHDVKAVAVKDTCEATVSAADQVERTLYERVTVSEHTGNILPCKSQSVERSLLSEYIHNQQEFSARRTVNSPDVCTGDLQAALNFLLCRRFEKAEEILRKVLAAYQPHVVYLGMCGPEEADMIEYACYTSTSGELSLFDKVRKLLAFDFTICKRDHVTPFLQQEQLFWNEDAVPVCIHPRIMTYYLYFLSALGQGQEGRAFGCLFALSMNVNSMCKNTNLYSYIAWNILGQCFFLMKEYSQALRAFCNSLKSKPFHNPALYYIGQC